ncbi:MAG: M28 family peptidase [Gemmatimonadetes bacterium]|nr:M28 family peptidase [Gemmatimonadota bacterium]
MRHLIAGAIVLAAACAGGSARVATPAGPRVAAPPGADELRRDLMAFADDSMRGREAGTPDAFRAARFLAARVRTMGLEPAGDSGFFQRVPLSRTSVAATSRVEVLLTSGARLTIPVGPSIVPLLALGPGAPLPRRSADAPLVFANYGVVNTKLGRDDFASLDVAGKAVVMMVQAPPGADSVQRQAFEAPQGISARLQRVLGMRPAAVVLVLAGSGRDIFEQVSSQLMRSLTPLDTSRIPSEDERPLPLVLIAREVPNSPLVPMGWPANQAAQFNWGTKLIARIEATRDRVTEYNVVGIVRGSDSALKSTYVAVGAHLDHIGIQGSGPDSIANGADDDGSGSIGALAIARAAAQGEPMKRSWLFVWHTAEEKGLFGSAYFTAHPTVPIDSIVAQLNADMIGRNGADSLYIVGPASAPKSQSAPLGAIADSVNGALARPFTIDRSFDSPTHPERIYYRSDHFNYASKGVPILFFTSGLHPDYHKVSDSPDKIDYAKMARISEYVWRVGLAVGNRPTRPRPPGPAAM